MAISSPSSWISWLGSGETRRVQGKGNWGLWAAESAESPTARGPPLSPVGRTQPPHSPNVPDEKALLRILLVDATSKCTLLTWEGGTGKGTVPCGFVRGTARILEKRSCDWGVGGYHQQGVVVLCLRPPSTSTYILCSIFARD